MNKKVKNNKQPKPLKDLTLLDRFLFDMAMSKPEICQNVLSIIFNDREVAPIHFGIVEKTLEPYYNSRAVRLDLLAIDENAVVYDAEAQKENKGNCLLRRRSRVYQSHIDVNLLEPGETDFGKLNDVYVIFIAPFDLFGQNKYMYTFRMVCDECPDVSLNDGAVRIFLNTRGENDEDVSPELVEMLHYIEETSNLNHELHSSRVRELANQIEKLKSNQEVGVKYMRFWEEMTYAKDEARAEGRAEGKTEMIYESVRNLQESLNFTLEQALEALKVTDEEWKKCVSFINKEENNIE